MLIGLTQLSTPCLPYRGRWPGKAGSEGVSLRPKGHSPSELSLTAPSERGPSDSLPLLLCKADKHITNYKLEIMGIANAVSICNL